MNECTQIFQYSLMIDSKISSSNGACFVLFSSEIVYYLGKSYRRYDFDKLPGMLEI